MSKYSLSLPRNKELFDSIAPQITEICTVSKSLPLFLKYSVKCLFLKRLYQTVENLKYKYTQKYKDFTGLSKIIIFADPDGTTFCGMKHGNVKIEKTNAARLLDRAKIAYELIPYRVDEEHLAATHVAEQLGEDVAAVFKTLVLRGDRTGHFVCVVPGDHEVDLKAAARISGNKKADLIPVRELLPTTGYIRGGCSPIGMKKPFPTFFHISVLQHSVIYISAGVRGLQIRIAPQDLLRFVGGETAEISRPSSVAAE